MTTQVWFRNPFNYVRELVECNQYLIAWDRGILVKRKIDPAKWADLYYGEAFDYRILIIGEQGTAELRRGDTLESPHAVYPTWSYGEELSELEDMLAYPVGEDKEICNTPNVAPDELPVFGQEHRVVVTGNPGPYGQSVARSYLRKLKELQEDYPDAILHYHGTYSWNVAFGYGFRAADLDPRFAAQKGRIHLPNGKEVTYEKAYEAQSWVKLVGAAPSELTVPRNRCIFNIQSAVWASQHFLDLFAYRTRNGPKTTIDTESSDEAFVPPKSKTIIMLNKEAKDGDKYVCDTCSLFDDCKYARSGSVCSLPGAEPVPLARYFGTRDSGLILDGLAILMKSSVRRYERGLRDEALDMDLNPEVTKLEAQLFDQGTKLAKLIDPSLRAGPRVAVNVGGGSAVQVNAVSPRIAIREAMRELEAQGVPREQITPDMIRGIFEGMKKPELAHQVVEAEIADD